MTSGSRAKTHAKRSQSERERFKEIEGYMQFCRGSISAPTSGEADVSPRVPIMTEMAAKYIFLRNNKRPSLWKLYEGDTDIFSLNVDLANEWKGTAETAFIYRGSPSWIL